jgi:transglutaminase-like putative cysteine protease
MRLTVHYDTSYRFSSPATGVIQLLRLTPRSCATQNVTDWRIGVDCDARLREGQDGYGNITHMLYVDQPVNSLKVSVSGDVLTEDRAGVIGEMGGELPREVFLRHTALTYPDAALEDLAAALIRQGGSELEKLHRLNSAIHQRLAFEVGASHAGTTAAEAYAAGSGVCQDFAHVFVSVSRAAGLAARYISGHLFQRDGNALQNAGHAWVEAWVPDLGWVAFDPTNGLCADDAYIRIATGLDYKDAAPFTGARKGGGDEDVSVQVQVVPKKRSQSQFQSQGGGVQSQSQSQS